jgi:hypothetical protein
LQKYFLGSLALAIKGRTRMREGTERQGRKGRGKEKKKAGTERGKGGKAGHLVPKYKNLAPPMMGHKIGLL